MIISFSVENFRSFRAEETLSLVASQRLSGSHDGHKIPIPGSREFALRASVIYGANGSGKSNLVKALRFLKQMVIKPRPKGVGTGVEPFKFEAANDTPSSFDLQFMTNGTTFRYGIRVDSQSVLEEWLVKISRGQEHVVYERVTAPDGKVTIEMPKTRPKDKVTVLASLGGPHNQTFLATIQATLDSKDVDDEIKSIIEWFTNVLRIVSPNESIEPLGHMLSTDATFRQFAGEFLKNSSTGIDHLEVEKVEITEDDLAKMLPKNFMDQLLKDVEEDEDNTAIVQLREGTELLVERKGSNQFFRISIQAAHSADSAERDRLSLMEESDGTRRLLQLVPALHWSQAASCVYVVDEIDRSMHPMLVWKFIESFLRVCNGGESQLIVTTHESNLLDLDLVRRDEVWFVEKDERLATHLYSLMDFKVRKDLEIRKHYLQGRFGAVPFLGNIDRLIPAAV